MQGEAEQARFAFCEAATITPRLAQSCDDCYSSHFLTSPLIAHLFSQGTS
jgi:hypothetical protein